MKIPYVSPSRLKKALECEFQYFLHYEWGWSDELFCYTFASEFGSSVHYTLEEYAASKGTADYKKIYHKHVMDLKPFSDDMTKAPSKAKNAFFIEKDCASCPFFDGGVTCEIMNDNVDEFHGCPQKLYDEGLVMVEVAIDRYGKYFETGIKSEDNPDGKVIGIEAPADISWGADEDGEDIKMNGFIDLVVEYDKETLLVVDYKTGYSVPEHEKFIKDLQPKMYSYAAKILYPEYKYHWVQFDYFRSIPLEHAFTDDDDEQTRREVVALFNRIKKVRSIRRRGEDWYCKYLCNRPFCDQKWAELKAGIDGSKPRKENDSG
ncbi:MAG: PD-(D/E)XK nuclease family protein [Candidatus Thorarchaeota archaeon]|jgi:hypothetical protein